MQRVTHVRKNKCASVGPTDRIKLASVTSTATPAALCKAVIENSINGIKTAGAIETGS